MIGKWKTSIKSNFNFKNHVFREEFVERSSPNRKSVSNFDEIVSELFFDYESSNCEKFCNDLKIINDVIDNYDCNCITEIADFEFVNLLVNAFFQFQIDEDCIEEILFFISVIIKCNYFCDFFFQKGFFKYSLKGITHENDYISLLYLRILSSLITIAYEQNVKFDLSKLIFNISNLYNLSNAHMDSCAVLLNNIIYNGYNDDYIDDILRILSNIFEDAQNKSTIDNIALICLFLLKQDIRYFNVLLTDYVILGELVEKVVEMTSYLSDSSVIIPVLEIIYYILCNNSSDGIIFAKRIPFEKYYLFIQDAEFKIVDIVLEIISIMLFYKDEDTFIFFTSNKYNLLNFLYKEFIDEDNGSFELKLMILKLSLNMILIEQEKIYLELIDFQFTSKFSFCFDIDDKCILFNYLYTIYQILQACIGKSIQKYDIYDIVETEIYSRIDEISQINDNEQYPISKISTEIIKLCNEFAQYQNNYFS